MKLEGKKVVLTGAASGIGRALLQDLSRYDLKLVAADKVSVGAVFGTLCMFEPARVQAIVILRDQNRDYLISTITRQKEEQD